MQLKHTMRHHRDLADVGRSEKAKKTRISVWDEHSFSFASVSVNTKYFPDNVSITHFAPETEISTISLSLKINQTLK